MKVLLISGNQEDVNMVTLPLGLALVAASAERSGHEVAFVDLMRSHDVRDRVASAIRRFHPEAIGVSVRNVDDQNMARPRFLLEQVKHVVDACRELSDAPLILGGAGYSIFPEAALDHLGADFGIQGEGEEVFPELLRRLANGRDLDDLPGLFRPGMGCRGERRFSRTLDEIPWSEAARRLTRTTKDPELMLPVQTRRGCPMRCSYCSTPMIEGRTLRKCPPDRAASFIETYVQNGFDRLFITDNTFNLPPSYAKDFCRALLSRGLKPSWHCILYPGNLDEELAELMARAGCAGVSLGFESGSDRILKRLNKRFTRRDVIHDRSLLARVGIPVMGFLLLGAPGETRDSVLESFEFLDMLNPERVRLTVGVRIYPKTPLARYAERQGVVTPGDDLLRPTFFLEPGLRDWLPETAEAWASERSHCIY